MIRTVFRGILLAIAVSGASLVSGFSRTQVPPAADVHMVAVEGEGFMLACVARTIWPGLGRRKRISRHVVCD